MMNNVYDGTSRVKLFCSVKGVYCILAGYKGDCQSTGKCPFNNDTATINPQKDTSYITACPPVKEYTLIVGSSMEVSREVSKKLKEGWELYGDPAFGGLFMGSGENREIVQAMIRREW